VEEQGSSSQEAAMDADRKRYAAKIAGVAAAYYGAAKLGLDLASETRSITAIWAPTGIALAALVLWGYRLWPGVALGAFLANSWTGVPFYTVLGITTGNTLEALAGAFLLQRVAGFRPSLERVRDVLALVVLAGIVSTTVSATIGTTSLLIGNEIEAGEFSSNWRTWWLGDMGGDLLVAPALMVWATHWPFRRAPGTVVEAIALTLLLIGVANLVFSQSTSVTYLIFPPLIWATLRFWQVGATTASLIVAGIAIAYTADEMGPFVAGNSPDERLLLAQTFVGVACITGLVLAAVIAERRRVEETVEQIAGTLQESLVPSRLPDIPGIESAVCFRAAGERHLVGGDFYDLFRSDDRSWAAVVGDVCGKGAGAAAVTGLARYTLRAAAIQERRPSRILELLNDAILRQRAPNEFCTVAFARLEPNGAAGARITLSSGGHPLPLVLRSDGVVETLGGPGTMLGLVADPKLMDYTAELSPGDSLVLYTDGLTDAYAPQRPITPADLASILELHAGRGAREIVDGIQRAVLENGDGEPRDDIALLVLRVPAIAVPQREVTVRLPVEPRTVAIARSAIAELEDMLGDSVYSAVRLLVSELVTNSVRHTRLPADATIELTAVLFADRLRVDVSDLGPGFEALSVAPDRDSTSGWGLYLVGELAHRWGVDTNGATRVWFEIDR
jgi:integral membrane sensor domain MASE1/anti-sigma regulatory factor (Ser/Thr protein kinase)